MEKAGNLLLDSLPEDELGRVLAQMEKRDIHIRDLLAEPGRPMERVYFPTDGIISTLTVLPSQGAIEAATVGWEGMVGIEVFLGADGTDNTQLSCQVDGAAWTMDTVTFRKESRADGPLRSIVERYVRTYFVQTTQTAACNGVHSVEERFAKWILMIIRWLGRSDFPLTHEFAAAMLGVHRPSVSLAAGALQRAGIIEYRRGHVIVLDADALHDVSCECVDVILRAYDELYVAFPGGGPGTAQRYAAMVAYTSSNWAYTRSLHSRAAGLQLEAASLTRTALWAQQTKQRADAESAPAR
jgi:CRP-like cAMP-binding protein